MTERQQHASEPEDNPKANDAEALRRRAALARMGGDMARWAALAPAVGVLMDARRSKAKSLVY